MITVYDTYNGLSHDKRFGLLDLYFRNMCTAASMAVFCWSLMSCLVGTLVRYFLNDFEIAPAAVVAGVSFFLYLSRTLYLCWKSFGFFLDRNFRRIRKIAKSDCSLRHVCLSARNNSVSTGLNFMKLDIWVFFENLSRKFKFHSNLVRITGTVQLMNLYLVGSFMCKLDFFIFCVHIFCNN